MGYASEQRRVTREVTFRLTDQEMIDKALKAADLRLARASILEEFARVKSTYKGRLEEKENELSTALSIIRDRQEKRVADVVDIFDFEQALVITTFGGQEVETRVMTPTERQLGFKFKTNDKGEQVELPLEDKAPVSPMRLGDPEPAIVLLPDPEVDFDPERTEMYVTGQPDRPTHVKHLAFTWRVEAGEGAMFRLGEQEIYGKMIRTWSRVGADPVSTEEPAPAAAE